MKKTDRKLTKQEEDFHNFIVGLGLKIISKSLNFLKEHPNSRIKELIRPFESQAEFSSALSELLKDQVAKFEYESITECVVMDEPLLKGGLDYERERQ